MYLFLQMLVAKTIKVILNQEPPDSRSQRYMINHTFKCSDELIL